MRITKMLSDAGSVARAKLYLRKHGYSVNLHGKGSGAYIRLYASFITKKRFYSWLQAVNEQLKIILIFERQTGKVHQIGDKLRKLVNCRMMSKEEEDAYVRSDPLSLDEI